VHPQAKAAIGVITGAQNKREAEKAVEAFAGEFGAEWPKALEKIASEKEALLSFYHHGEGSEPRAKHDADASIMARILNERMGSCVFPS
jgi:hypothetical protein